MTKKPCNNCEAAEICAAPNQPYGIEVMTVDGVFIKQMVIPDKGTIVPQHSHSYDHMTMLAVGEVLVKREGEIAEHFVAPRGIFIPANVKHTFTSLVDGTILYCVHNVLRTGSIEVAEEHHLNLVEE